MTKKQGDKVIEDIQSMAVFMAYYMCKDTNADKATITVSNATFKGESFGDYRVTIERLPAPNTSNDKS